MFKVLRKMAIKMHQSASRCVISLGKYGEVDIDDDDDES
jgi:hypothetical protein